MKRIRLFRCEREEADDVAVEGISGFTDEAVWIFHCIAAFEELSGLCVHFRN